MDMSNHRTDKRVAPALNIRDVPVSEFAVPKRFPDRGNMDAEAALLDHNVGPDMIDELFLCYDFAGTLSEINQNIERPAPEGEPDTGALKDCFEARKLERAELQFSVNVIARHGFQRGFFLFPAIPTCRDEREARAQRSILACCGSGVQPHPHGSGSGGRALRACLQRSPPFHPANCDRTLLPLRVSPEWGEDRHAKGVPLMETSSSHDTIGAGMAALAGEGRLPFLATKIVPARPGGLVARPRLLAMLSGLPAKQLGVIKAPAGFGKTSLAAAWAEQLEQEGCAVAWLTIDSDDDEATRFLFYLSQALHRACPDVGATAIELILENNLIDPPAILSSLINDLTEVEEDVYFFFEDYHWLSAPRIHQTVAYFLKHAPSHCHVVLTTRTEPPLPLATLRAQNQLIEIDAAALRFDMQETLAFLDRTRPGALEPSEVQLLQRKTEGWPAALRIIVSMASQSGPELKDYVHSLSGSQRPIAAYLSEMLDALPAELVDFMLRTAILDRLCGPLCEAVPGSSSSHAILAALAERQMLLTPLGNDGV